MVHAAKVTVSFLICLTSPLFAEYAVLLPRAGLPNYLVRLLFSFSQWPAMLSRMGPLLHRCQSPIRLW
ncbi:hypothetical protein BO79DRAFT_274115 [Aspergillus costaricaensis CBS 115574]|uniref:Uncharacterized protein n=1 Tax=Aspergillus costaricaensis CBS 115574 TaxID=1448317 RepID=A0ACD1I3C6_9EURO|nr:hypothetical protein BO79DRAFT_274115 [Aspergillus costaricaensis CBS 115574]RAK85008.1 hypothetical protein BO79DRAFT_274115 [Aspergillus costaricaensis CBS 115574]